MTRWYRPVPWCLLLAAAAAIKDPPTMLFYDGLPEQVPQLSYGEPPRSPLVQDPTLDMNRQLEARALLIRILLKSLNGEDKQLPSAVHMIKRRPYEPDANATAQETRPLQRKWKKKKGRFMGYEMCYFKLCSFRPKIMYDYNLD